MGAGQKRARMVAGRYSLIIRPKAIRTLKGLEKIIRPRIEAALLLLAENPRPPAAVKLKNSDFYRVRVGDYRILYQIHDDELIILIIDLGHRREIYK